MVPPKYKSLSKDLSKIRTEEDLKKTVEELYGGKWINKIKNVNVIEASSLVTSYDPADFIDDHKLQLFYQMILKDLSLIKYSLDFNDIKQRVIKLKIPLADFKHLNVKTSTFGASK